jgi:glycosyltransferase involved in cell wall biosynthesis
VEHLDQTDDLEVHASWSKQAENADRLTSSGVPSCPVDTFRSGWGALSVWRLIRAAAVLRAYVRRHRVDVVVVTMSQAWQAFALRALPRRVGVLLTVHDGVRHPGERSRVLDLLARLEIGRAQVIMCLSDAVAAQVRSRHPRVPVVVSALPADATCSNAPRELPLAPARLQVGFFGRLLEYKGVDLFAAAAEQLRTACPRLDFVVVGQGPVQVQETANLRVERRWVAEGDVAQVVDGFDLLVLPYREASQSGVVGLAVAAGVPVVATPVGGLAQQVAQTGIGVLTAEVSASAIAESVLRLCSDPVHYRSLSETALRTARTQLSWRRVAADYAAAVVALRPPSSAGAADDRSMNLEVPS